LADLEPRLAFARRELQPVIETHERRGTRRWYVSYAWSDAVNQQLEEKVDTFCKEATQRGVTVFRDKISLAHGDLISTFMQKLGGSDRIFIFLSEKYLRSPYCMFELFEMWRNSRRNKSEFLRRVRLFTVDGVRIGGPHDWLEQVKFWQDERDKLRRAINEVGWEYAGEEATQRLRLIDTFASKISDVLALFGDALVTRALDDFLAYGLLEYGFDDQDERTLSS
jgi:internalin A